MSNLWSESLCSNSDLRLSFQLFLLLLTLKSLFFSPPFDELIRPKSYTSSTSSAADSLFFWYLRSVLGYLPLDISKVSSARFSVSILARVILSFVLLRFAQLLLAGVG